MSDTASSAPSADGASKGSAPPRRIRMELCFDGTEYHGWQRQINGITVQEVLEDKLSRLFGGIKLRVQGSSRTDAGVHALGMVASFCAPESPYVPDWKIKKALNRLLPPSIKIRDVAIVEDSFDARADAQGKAYAYVINTGDLNPFTCRWSWHMTDFNRLDDVREAIKAVIGTHDFSSFTVERENIDDPVRSIFRAEVKTFGPLVCLIFMGDGFLYKMVRGMVGSLVEIGRGRMAPSEMKRILEARDRRAARDNAPGEGLFLLKVFYEPDLWKSFQLEQPPFFLL